MLLTSMSSFSIHCAMEYDPVKERDRWMVLLESAQDELVDAINQKSSLEHRIRRLQEDIGHLAALCGVSVEADPLKDVGLTDAIRYVIGRAKPQPLTAVGVKHSLVAAGFDISEYLNVMGSIYTVLKRLLKKKEILPCLPTPEGDKTYIWAGGMPPPPPLPQSLKKRLQPSDGGFTPTYGQPDPLNQRGKK